jgi:beta-galactosidase
VDWLPLSDGGQVALAFADGTQGRADVWSELIELDGAEAVATFAGSRLDGRPAVTRHAFGSGLAIYLGTRLDELAMARLVRSACADAALEAPMEVPSGVEVVRRRIGRRSILFLLNHRDKDVDVPITQAGVNLVDGAQVHAGLLRIVGFGAAVIREGW